MPSLTVIPPLSERSAVPTVVSDGMPSMRTGCRRDVVLYSDKPAADVADHHAEASRHHIATRLAALHRGRYLGYHNNYRNFKEPGYPAEQINDLYFVPVETLLTKQAQALGINSAQQLFGGIVAHNFMATKSITHPLIDNNAVAPMSWSSAFTTAVATAVLDGYTAFSIEDAHMAAQRLLKNNPVRIKCALGIGGSGQYLVRGGDEVAMALQKIDREEIENYGVVLEQHLDNVTTFSVGQVDLAGISIAYFGTQRLTKNHQGDAVYGGSTLHIFRGTLETLRGMQTSPALRVAIAQTCRYDTSALRHLDGLVASRRNYDVAQGLDRNGVKRSGVLEQSWRAGGATPAEIAAIEAMLHDPQLRSVRASTHEHYDLREPPANAIVYFQGIDAEVGALTKYTTIDGRDYF